MCGIIGILSRPTDRRAPEPDEVLAPLDEAVAADSLEHAAVAARRCDHLLKGVPGARALFGRYELAVGIEARLDQLEARAAAVEGRIESDTTLDPDEHERIAAQLIDLRDATWAIRHDRLRTAREVEALAGRDSTVAAIAGYLAIQQALSALDRLEVRGRDSAGLHLFVWNHGLSVADPAVQRVIFERNSDPLFQNGSVRVAGGCLGFVYKAAAEIGELGDNTSALRAAIADDALLRLALSHPEARLTVLGHTRWASVGIISEANCHPLNSEELEQTGGAPYMVAVLNGDVDNHADIKIHHSLRIAGPITTDAKVIPAVMARHVAGGVADLGEAFRRTVAEFEGSVAIGAAAADRPDQLFLALRGSGQALYVGLSDDLFIVASEPYGVVEETTRFVRMDGESLSPSGSRGQVFVLDGSKAGQLDGMRRMAYDGGELPLTERDVATAQVTTRDIDRGDSPHYLLKEISEAPASFRKTIRGKIVEVDGLLRATVGARALPPEIRARLADGSITKIKVIGQGTAAVAGRSMAAMLDTLADGQLDVDPITATELSGFGMRLDMRDTLVVAVSQSGTTTDTNRTVDLVRGRGAAVLAIVNRRNSDLTDKADGVMYTSDGRDVEMSVASTKAFYAQVAAGVLLACAITEAANVGSAQRRHDLLTSLRQTARCVGRGAVATRRHRRRCSPIRAVEAVLGDRRQRSQHGGRRRGADQAQRAVLQVDRLRRHRRQEAHRSLQ